MDNYLAAWEVMTAEYVESTEHDYLLGTKETQLDKIIKEENKNSLSGEAKFVIEVLSSSNKEIINVFGKISKGLLTKFLRKKGWQFKKIYAVKEELKEYTKTF